jgi:hypothetical protein
VRGLGDRRLWALRAVWLTLPLSAGPGLTDAIDATFDDASRIVAAVLCWLAWGLGALALLAPRPVGLTVLRAIAPAAATLSVVVLATGAADGAAGWGALLATVATAVLVADPALAVAAANAVAYGDERRFPLRTPPSLYLGLLPLVRLLVVTAATAPPLLLASGRLEVGLGALAVGAVVGPLGARALHGLSRRWVVLVPAGVVIADPLTLADPTLFVREHVRSLRALDGVAPAEPGLVDLRLGATAGSLLLVLDEAADLLRSGSARRGGRVVAASLVVVAVSRRGELLEAASARRVRVQVR